MNSLVDVQCKLFYVDDDQDDLEIFKEAVEDVGESVCLFKLADDMLHALEQTPHPAIVFVDLNMPMRNGYDVIKDIKNSNSFKHLPIIAFSTASDLNSITKSKELGASLYVTKPTSKKAIEKIIRYVASINWINHQVTAENFLYKD